MPRHNLTPNEMAKFQSKAKGVALGTTDMIFGNNGPLPTKYLGLNYSHTGSSAFAKVAHRGEQLKRMENLKNDTVSSELSFMMKDAHGVITHPFEYGGKIYRPDSTGWVRITDKGRVSEMESIKLYQRQMVDKLMEYALMGDDMCRYIFGIQKADWDKMTAAGGEPPGMHMSADLKKLQCDIAYIDSLPPSLTQSQSMSKLRKIVEFYADSVNLDGLTDANETTERMKDDNPPEDGSYGAGSIPTVATPPPSTSAASGATEKKKKDG